MLYARCPTCSTAFADKEIPYELEMEKICNARLSLEEENKRKEELVNRLGIPNYCCRMRFLGYIDTIKIIR